MSYLVTKIKLKVERYALSMPLTTPILELLWHKGYDDIRSLTTFVLIHRDISPEAYPNRGNVIASNLIVWHVIYYIRAHHQLIDVVWRIVPTLA